MSDWSTTGYEDLELSTQLVIKAALDRDIKVEILDPKSQWIRLQKGTKCEIIRQGSETSADTYIAGLILGDKFIQKKLLQEKNISVPIGQKYLSHESATQDFENYSNGQWVVKPTTTNYGVGITMLPPQCSKTEFSQAIKSAFTHDESVIIETFAPGIECRFLVIGGKCRAVLNRVPANVIGDGKKNIAELVEEKNKDSRRGANYKTPLEKIKIGESEIATLKAQNLTSESIPEKDHQVWLRRNSNISTGGDSLDYTDAVHEDYKIIAEQASQAVGAQICGVDMIFSDHTNPATNKNHFIIELNYNPVLYFHDFPYEGKNRNVAPYVLDLLGF